MIEAADTGNQMSRYWQGIRTISPWIGLFCLLAATHIILLILNYPIRVHRMLELLPSTATAVEKQAAADAMNDWGMLRAAFLPFRLLLGWIPFALLLYYTTKIFNPPAPVRIKQMVSLEMHAEIIPAIGAIVGYVTRTPLDKNMIARTPLSVATMSFVPDAGAQWVTIMLYDSLNPFQLLYVLVLALGIAQCGGFGKLKSILIALFAWGISIFCNITLMQFAAQTMHIF